MKVIILSGVPASGKSTWAKKFVKEKGTEWVIVNKDSIRLMFGDYFIQSREKLVKQAAENMINIALSNGYSVIIDETNITDKKIESVIRMIHSITLSADIEVKRFEVSKRTSIRRDLIRRLKGGHYVGKETIESFFKSVEPTK